MNLQKTMSPTIEFDFFKDFREIFIEEILETTSQFSMVSDLNNQNYLKQKDFNELGFIYYNFKTKFPELKNRKVIILDNCKNSILYQTKINEINLLKTKFENGDNFYSYLNKRVL